MLGGGGEKGSVMEKGSAREEGSAREGSAREGSAREEGCAREEGSVREDGSAREKGSSETSKGESESLSTQYLMRGPGDGLDGGGVFRVGLHRSGRGEIPDHQLVIVASRCQHLVVWRPLQTADLLRVTNQLADGCGTGSMIPLEDGVVTATRRNHVIVPCYGTC